jgi:cell cycle checkpoint control protein RAD9A
MDCTIPSHNVRAFCAALVCLSKIGKELYVEFDALDLGLKLSTLNDAKSAYCTMTFRPSFFERCTAPPLRKKRQKDDDDDDDVYKCRLPVRALSVLTNKARSSKSNSLQSLRIRNEATTHHMYLGFEFVYELPDKQTLRLLHRLGVIDTNNVQAVSDAKDASVLTAVPDFWLQLVEPLSKTAVEVAIIVSPDIVSVASFYHNSTAGSTNLVKTQASVGTDELHEMEFVTDRKVDEDCMPRNVNESVTLVCTLRECKAFWDFCGQADGQFGGQTAVTAQLHWGGKPLTFETNTSSLHASLVMATLDYKLLDDGQYRGNVAKHKTTKAAPAAADAGEEQ